MADQVITGDGVLVRVNCYASSIKQLGVNDLWYLCGLHAGLGATTQEVADYMDLLYAPLYKLLLCIQAAYSGTTANRYRPPSPPTLTAVSVVSAGGGTIGTDMLPTQVRGLIKKRALIGGRKGQGRIYVPFPAAVSSNSDGECTAAYQSALTNLGNAMDDLQVVGTIPNTSTLAPVLYNRATNTASVVSVCTASPIFATQRRSGAYGRENPPPF